MDRFLIVFFCVRALTIQVSGPLGDLGDLVLPTIAITWMRSRR